MPAFQPRHLLLVLAALLLGWMLFNRSRGRIDSGQAHKLVEAGAKLIDVRSPAEFASGHLPGATNVPLDQLARRIDELGAKDQPIVLYCASGMRSGRALGMLQSEGFSEAHNLGGMSNW